MKKKRKRERKKKKKNEKQRIKKGGGEKKKNRGEMNGWDQTASQQPKSHMNDLFCQRGYMKHIQDLRGTFSFPIHHFIGNEMRAVGELQCKVARPLTVRPMAGAARIERRWRFDITGELT